MYTYICACIKKNASKVSIRFLISKKMMRKNLFLMLSVGHIGDYPHRDSLPLCSRGWRSNRFQAHIKAFDGVRQGADGNIIDATFRIIT